MKFCLIEPQLHKESTIQLGKKKGSKEGTFIDNVHKTSNISKHTNEDQHS